MLKPIKGDKLRGGWNISTETILTPGEGGAGGGIA